jgi:hypothetical protein
MNIFLNMPKNPKIQQQQQQQQQFAKNILLFFNTYDNASMHPISPISIEAQQSGILLTSLSLVFASFFLFDYTTLLLLLLCCFFLMISSTDKITSMGAGEHMGWATTSINIHSLPSSFVTVFACL